VRKISADDAARSVVVRAACDEDVAAAEQRSSRLSAFANHFREYHKLAGRWIVKFGGIRLESVLRALPYGMACPPYLCESPMFMGLS
jgi:hypothetical protein